MGRIKLTTVTICLLISGPALAQTAPNPHPPVPDTATQAAANLRIQDQFKLDLQRATSPEARAALAQKLLVEADKSGSDPARRFVLLRLAARQAAEAQDLATAFRTIDLERMAFAIDVGKERLLAISRFAEAAKLPLAFEIKLRVLSDKEVDRNAANTDDVTTAIARLRLGDEWQALAHDTDGLSQKTMHDYASALYHQAAPLLTEGYDKLGKVPVTAPPTPRTDVALHEFLETNNNPISLQLAKSWITDTGLKELNGRGSLQSLNLCATDITNAGLKELKGLNELWALDLSDTRITDDGLKELKDLKSLQYLNIHHTHITDAGLKSLKGLASLKALWIDGTGVTDASLANLMGLKNLVILDVSNTRMSDAAVKELKAARPSLWVFPR